MTVGYPDLKGREAILKVHAKGKPLAPDVDLNVIARSTVGFTGADLENLLNEAALLAARRDQKAITMTEIEEATIKVVVGTEKKSHKMSSKEKKLTAYHEAGHAVATSFWRARTRCIRFRSSRVAWRAVIRCPCRKRIRATPPKRHA